MTQRAKGKKYQKNNNLFNAVSRLLLRAQGEKNLQIRFTSETSFLNDPLLHTEETVEGLHEQAKDRRRRC